jgi:hypothetical protein
MSQLALAEMIIGPILLGWIVGCLINTLMEWSDAKKKEREWKSQCHRCSPAMKKSGRSTIECVNSSSCRLFEEMRQRTTLPNDGRKELTVDMSLSALPPKPVNPLEGRNGWLQWNDSAGDADW